MARGPPGVRGELPRGPRATPEKLETRRILTKQKYWPYQQATSYRTENFAGVCYAMSFGYAILIRHVLAQPEVRKVEAGAPWAVGSAIRAWNFCGVHCVTKVENLCTTPRRQPIRHKSTENASIFSVVDQGTKPLAAVIKCSKTKLFVFIHSLG